LLANVHDSDVKKKRKKKKKKRKKKKKKKNLCKGYCGYWVYLNGVLPTSPTAGASLYLLSFPSNTESCNAGAVQDEFHLISVPLCTPPPREEEEEVDDDADDELG
jgi:hypothetical protein